MNRLIYLSCLAIIVFLLAACAVKDTSVPTTVDEQQAEAEALIRHSLSDRLVENARMYYREQVGSFLAGKEVAPEKAQGIVSEEMQIVIDQEQARLIETLVPIYRRFYTPAEIHQLLSFYRTDVARKSMRVSSQIAAESGKYIRLWNDNFGDQLLQRVHARLEAEGIPIGNSESEGQGKGQ